MLILEIKSYNVLGIWLTLHNFAMRTQNRPQFWTQVKSTARMYGIYYYVVEFWG